MRRLSVAIITVVSTIALTQIASAADLGRRPIYAPQQVFRDWTGCYVGLNAGGVWGRMKNEWTPSAEFEPEVVSSFEANGSSTLNASGFTGGGQVGCNWQAGQVVVGVEGDGQYTALDGSRDVFVPASFPVVPLNIHEDFRSRWLATFRGRFGWLANPFVLLYATGGLAVANVETVDSVISVANPANSIPYRGQKHAQGGPLVVA